VLCVCGRCVSCIKRKREVCVYVCFGMCLFICVCMRDNETEKIRACVCEYVCVYVPSRVPVRVCVRLYTYVVACAYLRFSVRKHV